MSILLTVFKSILAKYCTAAIIERVVIWGLGVLVKKTDSKADDELYEIVFGKLKGDTDDKETKNDWKYNKDNSQYYCGTYRYSSGSYFYLQRYQRFKYHGYKTCWHNTCGGTAQQLYKNNYRLWYFSGW